MIEIFILGTSSSFPTEMRSHPCIVLRFNGRYFMFDCGEGAQLRMRKAKISPIKIEAIFVTHWHGDHVLGIPGLIQSMSMNNRRDPLKIFGPVGTSKYLYHCLRCCSFHLTFKIEVEEIDEAEKPIKIFEEEDFEIKAVYTKHDIPNVTYSFETKPYRKIKKDFVEKYKLQGHPILKRLQKGEKVVWRGMEINPDDVTIIVPSRKFIYTGDTIICDSLKEISKNADVLLCESTYLSIDKEKGEERFHMTSEDAGKLARETNVRLLILTHFSQRYEDVSPLLKEALRFHPFIIAAEDFIKIEIRRRDGKIRVVRIND